MIIGVTALGTDGGRSGIGRYVTRLLKALAADRGDDRFEVAVLRSERGTLVPRGDGFTAINLDDRLAGPPASLAWHWAALPVWAATRRWDVLFLPAANRRLPLAAPCPTVGTVHDLAPLRIPGKYDPLRQAYAHQVLPVLIRRLDRILVPSEATRRDVIELIGVPPDRIHVTPLAADGRFRPADRAVAARTARRLGIRGRYLLYVSRIEHPGKNHVRLIRAFARLKELHRLPHQLVLAGPDWSRAEEVHRVADSVACRNDIVFPGRLQERDLPALYAAADACIIPSLYEGFGLPVLEAMASGTPVACSDVASLPEVAGGAALLFDPEDEDALAAAMDRLAGDAGLRQDLSRRGLARAREFSWDRTARATLDVIRDTAGAAAGRRAA